MWGSHQTFAEVYWPPDYEGEIDEEEREVWGDRPVYWYAPLDWVNFVDQETFTTKFSLLKRYTLMLYYGVLILGLNEMGPINEIEMLYCIVTLLFSALLNALLFGDIASLALTISKHEIDF